MNRRSKESRKRWSDNSIRKREKIRIERAIAKEQVLEDEMRQFYGHMDKR
jgi:hypothetical protein